METKGAREKCPGPWAVCRGNSQCWDERVCLPYIYTLGGKKKIFPLPSGFKQVFARYLTDTCFKRFKGNWLS